MGGMSKERPVIQSGKACYDAIEKFFIMYISMTLLKIKSNIKKIKPEYCLIKWKIR